MSLIVDAHSDIAYNILRYGRDYLRTVDETRRIEHGSELVKEAETCTVSWHEYQRANIAIVFATLFALPARWNHNPNTKQTYKTFEEARAICREQMDVYWRMNDSVPEQFQIVASHSTLEAILAGWSSPTPKSKPVGMVLLMEGADGIRDLDELEEWHERGLRLIGPAWVGTRYSGGWREPGALTKDGRKLLSAMADYNFTLDLSHMDEQASLESLDIYRGPIVATHANCLARLPGSNSNRHLSDRVIHGIIERDGVIGVVPYNSYLKVGWAVGKSKREEISLDMVASHIDHICQIAGDSLHAGIGSDFDGGFGLESIPMEMDTVADLQKLEPLLQARGYSEMDISNIMGGNWIARLKRDLP